MNTKTWICIAVLLLAAGCTNGAATDEHEAQNQAAGSASTLTQASSISTEDMKRQSMSMQQANDQGAGWLEWLIGRNAPNRAAVPQQPPVRTVQSQQPPAGNANPQPSGNASQFPQQVLDLVNKERTKAGLKSLRMNDALSKMAMDKAKDMYHNNYFDHQSPTYGSPFDMMNAYGITYNTAAENIANGQRSPTEVMNAWMNSQGHRANILNGSFTDIGIAYYNGEWVQVFIG